MDVDEPGNKEKVPEMRCDKHTLATGALLSFHSRTR